MAADAAERTGLSLSSLSKDTLETLNGFVPHTGSMGNPVDITFSKNPLDYFKKIPDVLLQEKNADGLMIYFLTARHTAARITESMGVPVEDIPVTLDRYYKDLGEQVAGLVEKNGKPILGYSFLPSTNPLIRYLRQGGVPVLPSPGRAARAFSALTQYVKLRNKMKGRGQ